MIHHKDRGHLGPNFFRILRGLCVHEDPRSVHTPMNGYWRTYWTLNQFILMFHLLCLSDQQCKGNVGSLILYCVRVEWSFIIRSPLLLSRFSCARVGKKCSRSLSVKKKKKLPRLCTCVSFKKLSQLCTYPWITSWSCLGTISSAVCELSRIILRCANE